jgi:ornithine cyclodeaminase/alanine dehydrogenase-like protein (mu-crystallin family)
MRIVSNEELQGRLSMSIVVDVLREAYASLVAGESAYIPLISLFAPTAQSDEYYRCGAQLGVASTSRVAAIRIKSDVLSWPGGTREEKYCIEPGTYCGLILLFSLDDGRPLAIIQDGIIQHMRVGAALAIGVDLMARPDASTVGMLGSGGMARSTLEAISCVRTVTSVNAFSPTRSNLEAYCSEMSQLLDIEVVPMLSAEEAVTGCDIVVTATNSLKPTLMGGWLSSGSHVSCVSRGELGDDVYDRATLVAQLGYATLEGEVDAPSMERVKGGFAAYIAGTPEQRRRVPRPRKRSSVYPTIGHVVDEDWRSTRSEEDISLFLPIGTQGLQFAAVGGYVWKLIDSYGLGKVLPTEWFVENIRN